MFLKSLEDTQTAAFDFARSLETSSVLLFYGNLGAGKTTFIKALAKVLGVEANVTSPTFVGMNVYQADKFTLYHFDLYQVKPNLEELLEIIEDRHNRKSTIISSQLPVSKWYEVIGESTIADAVLDRMVHSPVSGWEAAWLHGVSASIR